MALEHRNPEALGDPGAFTQVVTARGTRTVYVAGQVAAKDGQVVGRGDFLAQARQAFENVGHALAAAGATWADVAKTTVYIVNYTPELRAALAEVRRPLLGPQPPASTLIGVQALAHPDFLIEVEAVAVLD